MNTLLGLVVGLMLGAGAAYAVDHFRDPAVAPAGGAAKRVRLAETE
jgi:hypothetical protein